MRTYCAGLYGLQAVAERINTDYGCDLMNKCLGILGVGCM